MGQLLGPVTKRYVVLYQSCPLQRSSSTYMVAEWSKSSIRLKRERRMPQVRNSVMHTFFLFRLKLWEECETGAYRLYRDLPSAGLGRWSNMRAARQRIDSGTSLDRNKRNKDLVRTNNSIRQLTPIAV